MKILKSIIKWLVVSSENPENVSLTLQATVVAFIPAIMIALHLLNIPIGQNEVQNIIGLIEANLVVALQMIAAGIALFGGIRKIYNTIFDKVQPTV